jgi:hypothetical protein
MLGRWEKGDSRMEPAFEIDVSRNLNEAEKGIGM